uniref:Uncharacterized protein n=1 Tax=Astyanax mexicanus TaxID=7994 RepID=A0A3B1JRC6_ASTMX
TRVCKAVIQSKGLFGETRIIKHVYQAVLAVLGPVSGRFWSGLGSVSGRFWTVLERFWVGCSSQTGGLDGFTCLFLRGVVFVSLWSVQVRTHLSFILDNLAHRLCQPQQFYWLSIMHRQMGRL